jgi:chromosome partitioning protein
MPVIAVLGLKGGTGKTTTTLMLAAEWHRRGRNVLILDGDVQRAACYWGQLAEEKGVTHPRIVSFVEFGMNEDRLLSSTADFDVLLIDCPPQEDSECLRRALGVASLALLPCGMSVFERRMLEQTSRIVLEACNVRASYTVLSGAEGRVPTLGALEAAVLITRRSPQSASEERFTIDIPTLRTELKLRDAYVDAVAQGTGVFELDPQCEAAIEVGALAEEIEQRLGMNEPSFDRAETTQRMLFALGAFELVPDDMDTIPDLAEAESTDRASRPILGFAGVQDDDDEYDRREAFMEQGESPPAITSTRIGAGQVSVRGFVTSEGIVLAKPDGIYETLVPSRTPVPHRRTFTVPIVEGATSTSFRLLSGVIPTVEEGEKRAEVIISHLKAGPAREIPVHLNVAISGSMELWVRGRDFAPEIVSFVRARSRRRSS